MTDWPWSLVEVALYALLAAPVVRMTLDVRNRWKARDTPTEGKPDTSNERGRHRRQ